MENITKPILYYQDEHYECYGNGKVEYFRIGDKYYMNDNPEEWGYQSSERKSDKEITFEEYKGYTQC